LVEVTQVQRLFKTDERIINNSEVVDKIKIDLKTILEESEAVIETDFKECNSLKYSKKNF